MAFPQFPRGAAVAPLYLSEFENGKIPLDRLTVIDGGGRLASPVANAWIALRDRGRADGFEMTYTGTYRSYERQWALFFERYTSSYDPIRNTTADQRTFLGVRYYKRRGVAAAATPGSSPHGLGLAIDVSLDHFGTAARSVTQEWSWWAVEVAPSFGFLWSLQSEPWHLQWIMGDRRPRLPEEAPSLPVLQMGSSGPYVVWAQTLMRDRANQAITVDGVFGNETRAAVLRVQTFVHHSGHPEFEINGTVDLPTWWVLGSLPAPA